MLHIAGMAKLLAWVVHDSWEVQAVHLPWPLHRRPQQHSHSPAMQLVVGDVVCQLDHGRQVLKVLQGSKQNSRGSRERGGLVEVWWP